MDALAALSDPKLGLASLLKHLDTLDQAPPFSAVASFGLSGGVTIDQLAISLRRHAYLNERRATVAVGGYKAHLENLEKFAADKVEHVVVLDLLDNLQPALESRLPTLPAQTIDDLEAMYRAQLRLIVTQAAAFKSLHLVTPAPILAASSMPHEGAAAAFARRLVAVIDEEVTPSNIAIHDLGALLVSLGLGAAIDLRMYTRFKAPFTMALFDRLARDVVRETRGAGRYFYKVLALDCDETLWGGIVGEDGIDGIALAPEDYPGNVYWRVQHELVALQKRGTLLALCSKNNAADVDEVLTKHPHCVIRDEHLVAKQVNWSTKAANLRALAAQLDLGLDSFVFLDDSSFELDGVRTELPQVRTVQVPKNPSEYLATIRELASWFPGGSAGGDKTEQYRLRAQAKALEAEAGTREDFLKSLGLQVTVRKNDRSQIPRIAELTQKSNQFNVTTRRYFENDIVALMDAPDADVFSLHVRDKFGDSGLTGVCIVRVVGRDLVVDTFLMSCRVIGRGIELGVWPGLVAQYADRVDSLRAEYIKTAKNELVVEFFEHLGLPVVETTATGKRYAGPLSLVGEARYDHLEVSHEG